MLSTWVQSALAWHGTHSSFWHAEAFGSVQSVSLTHSTHMLTGAVSVGSAAAPVLHSGPRGLPLHCALLVHSTQPDPARQAGLPGMTAQSRSVMHAPHVPSGEQDDAPGLAVHSASVKHSTHFPSSRRQSVPRPSLPEQSRFSMQPTHVNGSGSAGSVWQ